MPADNRYWGNRLTLACAKYYCVCGLVALALDLVSYRMTGRFQVASHLSVVPMSVLLPIGTIASAIAMASHPSGKLLFAAAIALTILFLAATTVAWCLMIT